MKSKIGKMNVFLAAIGAYWPQHILGNSQEFLLNFINAILNYNGFLTEFWNLSVLDHFDDELGGEKQVIESQS